MQGIKEVFIISLLFLLQKTTFEKKVVGNSPLTAVFSNKFIAEARQK